MTGLGDQIQIWLGDPAALQVALLILGVAVLLALFALRERGRQITALRNDLTELDNRHDRVADTAREAELRAGQAQTRLEERDGALLRLGEERDGLNDALYAARRDVSRLESDLAQARLAAEKDRERAAHDIETLRGLREEMTRNFRLMADETLRVQGDRMQQAHREQLDGLLTPFRDQVHRFQSELQTCNKVMDEEGARLREQIEALHRRSEDIGREAVALTRALKGEKQRQGAWGEMILERILEDSGLIAGTHYHLQQGWRDEDGARWRPDVIVHMPQKKILVIDSKVSLNDYEISVNAEDEDVRAAALRRHVQALRTHIAGLSGKGYHRIDDASVDYVLMFIPVEGAFSEALRADPELTGFALERKIGLATPTTLMLTLRTVDHIWTVERRESNAMEIASRAGALYDKVAGFIDSMDGVGRALDQAGRAHQQAMDRLTRGSGNVVRQVEMLRELGARAQKRIETDHDRTDAVEDRSGDVSDNGTKDG